MTESRTPAAAVGPASADGVVRESAAAVGAASPDAFVRERADAVGPASADAVVGESAAAAVREGEHAPRQVRTTAHRGDSSRYRENTLPAIGSAMAAGADFVEVDVRLTRDGQVILLHDATLERLWGLPKDARTVDYAEAAGLGGGQDRIPLLSEALALFQQTSSTLVIDMDEPGPAAAAHAVVAASGVDVAWCGDLAGMRIIRSLDSTARIWLPWDYRTAPGPADLAELEPEYVNSEYMLLSPGMVEAIHAGGGKVSCWTVDDVDAMKWVLNLGVDAVTTNQLTLLQSIVASAGGRTESDGAKAPPRLSSVELAQVFAVAHELGEWAIEFTSTAERGAVSTKANPADLVTEVDLAVERHVREVIAARFPAHGFVGEEMGGSAAPGVPCWYLDPVDGTTNFANRVPWTAFSLALAIDRTPLVGVVADPWRADLFEAVSGYGARLNGAELRIADDGGAGRDPLSGTVIGTELAAHLSWPGMLPMLAALGKRHATMRIMGSGTMTLVGVAAGRGAGAVIGSFGPVDHLAALLIVAEAGGVVLDADGVPNLFPSSGGILAASPLAAQELYELWRAACAQAR